MRVVLFCHSLLSDWNHGNAHFLRGIVAELLARGHDVRTYEPRDAWSVENLVREHGAAALDVVREAHPWVDPVRYDLATLDVDGALDGADLVLVHEWNAPELVARIGERRRRGGFRLLFHDTHHRMVTAPHEMGAFDLSAYDGVLAFGAVVRDLWIRRGWAARAWTWHEAADVRVFAPQPCEEPRRDVVFVGNWGDGERTAELGCFLFTPARRLALEGTVHGVRWPDEGRAALAHAGLEWGGWVANTRVPHVFARHRVTVHVPRRAYADALPGIPTIRPFEAMACGIPLVSAPWDDAEGLFRRGVDHLVARDEREMTEKLRTVLADRDLAASLAREGLATIRARHTCAHRVDELLRIVDELGHPPASPAREESSAA